MADLPETFSPGALEVVDADAPDVLAVSVAFDTLLGFYVYPAAFPVGHLAASAPDPVVVLLHAAAALVQVVVAVPEEMAAVAGTVGPFAAVYSNLGYLGDGRLTSC